MVDPWFLWTLAAGSAMAVMVVVASFVTGRSATPEGARTWARRCQAWSLVGVVAIAAFFPAHEPISLLLIGDNWGLGVWFGLAEAATLAGIVPLCLVVGAGYLAAAYQPSRQGGTRHTGAH